MIRILIVALAAAAAMTAAQRPAHASDPPWCLIGSSGEEHCRYNSLDDCLRDRVGGGGFCNPNPRYQAAPQSRSAPSRHGRRRY